MTDSTTASPLISAADLALLLKSDTPVTVLDVRWRLDKPNGTEDHAAAHLPGAVYVDLDTELAAHGAPTDGRHPLPDVAALQAAARSWGLDEGDTVIVYDDLRGLSAARAWWLLRHAGITDVRVLDGGLRAWTAANLPVEEGAVTVEPGTVTLAYGHLASTDLDGIATFDGLVLDVRAAERYTGEAEPIDPRAGHIPGAVNAPTTGNLDSTGLHLDPVALAARFAALGVRAGEPVAVYCGSGVTASHSALALSLAGFEPVLFPGSWSQWSNHPELPVATGDQPG